MNNLIIIGASGQGKVIADIAEKLGYTEIAFLDDNTEIETCGKFKIIGISGDAVKYPSADFIVAIGNAGVRKKIQKKLIDSKMNVVSLIHPAAVVASDVVIGEGTVVMAGAVVNPNTKIGSGCIINTCSSVDHDCVINDFVHVSVGAHVAGTVNVGENTWIGIGAAVSNNIDIASDCIIGAGAVVVKNISEPGTYIGIPAKKIK